MNKKIALPVRFEPTKNGTQASLTVNFEIDSITEWCLGLILLRQGLITNLVLVDQKETFSLEIEVLSNSLNSKLNWHEKGAKLQIAANELDYSLKFFLIAYRDHSADVDHIDLECYTENLDGNVGYVTMTVDHFKPPLSAKELKKRLN